MGEEKKEIIQKFASIAVLIILIVVVGAIMIKYEVEGEKNFPFVLTKIMVVSTADGEVSTGAELSVTQSNDIYFYIEKNENYKKEAMIKNVKVENITVLKEPVKGDVVFYRPSTDSKQSYRMKEEYVIENNIVYQGAEASDLKTLTISNQGGIISFRESTKNIGTYIEEGQLGISNDNSLLKKVKASLDEVKCKISFDITIELEEKITVRANAVLDLPLDGLSEERVKGTEIIDLDDIIFKRVRI